MLINPTLEKLADLRLHGMAQAFRRLIEDPDSRSLSFEERVALLVDEQWTWRENKALARRLTNARFRLPACVEDIDWRHPRGLDRSLARSLATSQWVQTHCNLIILGPCGVGKTFLACAFAHKAVRDGYTALYTRAPRLFSDLAAARADGTLTGLFKKIARLDVLVVDDWAMAPLADAERRDFLEICEDRHGLRSTILTSQIPVAHWHEQIGDPTLADSILDRVVHNAYRLELKGASMRKQKPPSASAAAEVKP